MEATKNPLVPGESSSANTATPSDSTAKALAVFHNLETCRMYRRAFPEKDEHVMVLVTKTADMGAYVSLLEYGNIEGMILWSELSRRRVRSIAKHIRIGRQEVVVVSRVDPKKGYIDLSKRRVEPEMVAKTEERYQKSKKAHQILRQVASKCKIPMIKLYEDFGFDLSDKYGHLLTAFQAAVHKPENVFGEFKIEPEVLECLVSFIKLKLTPPPIKFRVDIEVTCFTSEGILAIKEALAAGLNVSSEIPIEISLVSPPLYVCTCRATRKQAGLDSLAECVQAIKEVITKKNGSLVVTSPPRATSKREDQELSSILENLAHAMVEVEADDDAEMEANF